MDGSYIYSPFSPETVSNGQGPALLLQLILKELLGKGRFLEKTTFSAMRPFDWAEKAGSYNKVQEHASLLPFAFSHLRKEIQAFVSHLEEPCDKLLKLMVPFIWECKENENLIYFLLKYQKHTVIKSLLVKLSPQGLKMTKAMAVSKYRKRGFKLPLWMR